MRSHGCAEGPLALKRSRDFSPSVHNSVVDTQAMGGEAKNGPIGNHTFLRRCMVPLPYGATCGRAVKAILPILR